MTSLSRVNKAWPSPENPEALFGAVLLECGPIPEKGWRVTCAADKQPIHICAGGKVAGAYQEAVISRCEVALREQVDCTRWREGHIRAICRMWKNRYLLWLFKELRK